MYTMTPSGVLRDGDGTVVPLDDSTPAYQAYAAWLAQGNGPQTVDDGPIYPSITVTAWQLIQALSQLGMYETIDSAASSASNPLVRIGWQRAPNFTSDDPLTIGMCETMGIDQSQRQAIFELAASF